MLTAALAAMSWRERERHLSQAYEVVAVLHNESGLTEPLDPATRPFHSRPYRVLGAERFAVALMGTVPGDLPLTGAVDQFVDNTDALVDRAFTRAVVSG